MGAAFDMRVSQWSKGAYPFADNPTQDDIATISKLLQPIRTSSPKADGSAPAFAPPTAQKPLVAVANVVSSSADVHLYRFRASSPGTVTLQLTVTPPANFPRSHLAAKLRLLRSDKSAVAGTPTLTNVGANGIDGGVSQTPAVAFTVPSAGVYFVELRAAGNGEFKTYGYSSYGSAGVFAITLGAPAGLVVDADGGGGGSTDRLACKKPTLTLTPGAAGCGAATVQPTDLYTLTGAAGAGAPPVGTVTLSSSASTFAPGTYSVTVTATAGGASCVAVVTVKPCRAVAASGTVALANVPGTCAAAAPAPSLVVAASSLGQGALSVNLRKTATGSIISAPFVSGSYFVQVVYPGGVLSAVSSGAVRIAVADTESPVAEIKPSVVRNADGFICAKGRSASATTACLSVSTSASTGVVALRDNCPAAQLTRGYACTGTCPAAPAMATATKVCVPVSRGRSGQAVFTLTVTDAAGRTGQVEIPVVAYHFSDAPKGVTCYSA